MPKGLKIKKIITVHDISPKIMPFTLPFSHRIYYNFILKRNIHTADHLITVSDFSKQEIIKYYGANPENISVIYNAARDVFKPLTEIEKSDIRNKYAGGERYFIYLGSINERKNADKIIKAFEIFKSTTKSGQKLILAGKRMGKFDKVINSLADSPFKNDIIELGYVEDSLAASLLASADALINLSEYEGFGMPIVEAMQCGVPVVASHNSCFPEIIQDAGLLTNPLDTAQIAKDIFTVFLHPSDLLSKNALQCGFEGKSGQLITNRSYWVFTFTMGFN
jgi:glycosyltransferase involved in cell wall biosynthesis